MADDKSGVSTIPTPPPPRFTQDEGHHKESLGLRAQHLLHSNPTLGPVVVLVLSVIAFSLLNDRFLQPANLSLVLQQVTVLAVLALGQTIIILTAGIDLSVGAMAVFCSIVMAKLTAESGWPAVAALLLGAAIGAGLGALNGVLVTQLRLPPFIATLGTLNIFFALTLYVSKSETIRGVDMPDFMLWMGRAFDIGDFRITYGTFVMLILFAVFFYVLRQTAWGKHVYATGDDREAARLAGIRTNRVLLSVYLVAGVIYAIGAWVLIGRLASASPNVGSEYNLDTITAVVIGGTSLFGGRGNVLGTLVGALIVGVFRNGLALAGVDVLWQVFAVGVLIIVAVSIDQWIRKVKA